MIYKPYSLLPSDLEDGSNVIDISQDVTFSFMVTGTTPIQRMGIQIGDLTDTNPTSLTAPYYLGLTTTTITNGSTTNPIMINGAEVLAYRGAVCTYNNQSFICDLSNDQLMWFTYTGRLSDLQTTPIYYTNIDGSAKFLTMTFPSETLQDVVGVTSDQKWRVWIRDINNEPTLADWVFVKLRTTPSAILSTSTDITTKSNTWVLSYTPSYSYVDGVVGTDATTIRSIRWRVFDKSYPDTALYDTGEIFGCVQPSYSVDGLMSGHVYYAEVIVVNQDGIVTTVVSDDVNVDYEPGPSEIMGLLYTSDIASATGDITHGREVALNITNFSGPAGESSGGESGYDTVNIGEPTGYVLENGDGNTITWDHIAYDGGTIITLRTRFTPVPYRQDADIMSLYVTDDRTMRVRYAIVTGGNSSHTLFPSDTLFPRENTYPSSGTYYISAIYEAYVDGAWVDLSHDDTLVDINGLSEDDLIYYENTFSVSKFSINRFGSDMRLELYGAAHSRVAYVVIDANGTSYSNNVENQYNPPVTDDTQFAVFFNNILCAVNLDLNAAPERVTFYRYTGDENIQFPLAKIELGEAPLPTYLIDLSAANGEAYKYVMYPEDDTKVYAGTHGYNVYDGGESIEGYVACEMLITSNWSDEYNAYVADRIFYFDFNNKLNPINNNAVVQKNQTFSRFFHIQHGATNVLSGQISSLIGYIDCATGEYVSAFEIEDAIRWLTTDHTVKFYKSARGYVLPVDITSAITFTPEIGRMASNVGFEWTEIKLPHTATVIGVIKL